MGTNHAERIADPARGACLAAVCDLNAELAHATAARFGPCRVEADPMAVIHSDDIDGIVIVTPEASHEELVLACLEQNLPVLCEKPLTPDPASSLRIVEAEVALGRRLVQVGYMRRFDPEYQELKGVLESGALGAPLMLHCAHRVPSESLPPSFTSTMLITNAAVHEVDIARWLLEHEITAVSVLSPRKGPPEPDAVATPQILIFETSGSVLVDVEMNVASGLSYQVRCEAVFESGTMLIGDKAGQGVDMRLRERDFRSRFAQAYDREVEAWVESVSNGKSGGPSAWDGYVATAVAEAGLESQRTSGRVEVALASRPALYAQGSLEITG
jgi:myo-inositol 2-dehydrogenase/D-chiro-inositol 1-dehydrogenase